MLFKKFRVWNWYYILWERVPGVNDTRWEKVFLSGCCCIVGFLVFLSGHVTRCDENMWRTRQIWERNGHRQCNSRCIDLWLAVYVLRSVISSENYCIYITDGIHETKILPKRSHINFIYHILNLSPYTLRFCTDRCAHALRGMLNMEIYNSPTQKMTFFHFFINLFIDCTRLAGQVSCSRNTYM